MDGTFVCIMATRTALLDVRCRIRGVGTHGLAKTICTRVSALIDLVGGYDAWSGWFANVECNCKFDNAIAMVLQDVRAVLL